MRLFLYADEPIVSEAMQFAFSRTDDIVLDRTLDAEEQILPAVAACPPDVLLLSLAPALHLGIIGRLREAAPECKIVLWNRAFSQEISHQAMDLGIRGVLPRTCSMELLIKCLRKVHEGELWFDRQLTANHIHGHRVPLTPRQAQLAQMVAEGRKNKDIAADLAISEGAVKVYLSHLFDKVGARDRTELAQLVMRNVLSVEHADHSDGSTAPTLRALYVDAPAPDPPVAKPRLSFPGK